MGSADGRHAVPERIGAPEGPRQRSKVRGPGQQVVDFGTDAERTGQVRRVRLASIRRNVVDEDAQVGSVGGREQALGLHVAEIDHPHR